MINEINIPIRRPTNGYYIRWYYNGWHYWHFIPGKQTIVTSGQLYNTISQKQVNVSSGPVNGAQVLALRTITCSKEVSLYSDDGWMNIRIAPGMFEVKNNYLDGYEIELTITVGSREASNTGYSPATPLPQPPPPRYALYGLLYNWHVVSDSREVAPVGWHIPSFAEIEQTISYIGDYTISAGKLKEVGLTHWNSPNTGATNEYGFSALGSGRRNYETGTFQLKKSAFYLWTGTTDLLDSSVAYSPGLIYNSLYCYYDLEHKKNVGLSLRCIRDSLHGWTEGDVMKDIDGNTYHTVRIGAQIWSVENLATTRYRNGDSIPEITDNAAWAALSTGALCAYNNDWTEVFIS